MVFGRCLAAGCNPTSAARGVRLTAAVLGLVLSTSALVAQSTAQLPDAPAPNPAVEQAMAMPFGAEALRAQTGASEHGAASAASGSGATICGITHIGRCIKDLAQDDKGIFTSPARVRRKDASWLLPLGAATGLAFAYDVDAEQATGYDKGTENTANSISNFGSFYAAGGEGAVLYFVGLGRHNPKLTETGRLGAEAVIDSGTVVLLTKLAADRERPLDGDRKGHFWTNPPGGWTWDSSFPSDHSAASMSLARVIAGEYPHWYVDLPAYGFAETIAVSRILANAHFPSDVVVGQAAGFLTGTYVLDHRALYRGKKKNLAERVIESAVPMTSARVHAVGVSVQIPVGD